MTKDRPIINQNVTSHNQSGGITAHTVNVGPQRLPFDPGIAEQLANQLPIGRPIAFTTAGPSRSDLQVGAQYADYLQKRGFNIASHDTVMMLMPAPEHKITWRDDGKRVIIIVAPSAN